MGKKYNKKELVLNSRTFSHMNKELTNIDNMQDKDLINYNNLKEKLKYNLKDDIDNKIERMKILYEIKKKNFTNMIIFLVLSNL